MAGYLQGSGLHRLIDLECFLARFRSGHLSRNPMAAHNS